MGHVILLGDSIFDNARYVPDRPPVIEQLGKALPPGWRSSLEAFAAGLPVIDLRLVCNRPSDYSHVSPIEPSMVGGAKIAQVIADVATTHDFGRGRSTIYA